MPNVKREASVREHHVLGCWRCSRTIELHFSVLIAGADACVNCRVSSFQFPLS